MDGGLGIIGWIVLGGLAGWVASMFAGTNARQGLLGNIVAGVIGGVVGFKTFHLSEFFYFLNTIVHSGNSIG